MAKKEQINIYFLTTIFPDAFQAKYIPDAFTNSKYSKY